MFLSGPGSACFESEEKAVEESESIIFHVAKMVYWETLFFCCPGPNFLASRLIIHVVLAYGKLFFDVHRFFSSSFFAFWSLFLFLL